jgi:uncharacterized protein YecT (DUF1311 family)
MQRSAVFLCLGGLVATAEAQSTKDHLEICGGPNWSDGQCLARPAINAVCSSWSDGPCVARFAEHLDRELDAIWSRVLASIDTSTAPGADLKGKLAEAQEYWVRFRRADCEAVRYEGHGVTAVPAAVSSCHAKHALGRIQDLKQRYRDLFK